MIAANAPCDVLIGVQGRRGRILKKPTVTKQPAPAEKSTN
jgi:hypothetical protein